MHKKDGDKENQILTGKQSSYREFHALLNQSNNITDLKNNLLNIVNELGFSDYIFMRMDRHWIDNVNYGLLYSVPDELMRIYHDEKMFAYDLLISCAMETIQPRFMSSIYEYINCAPYEVEFINRNRMIQQLNRRFLFFDQYAIPITACNGNGNVQLVIMHKNVPSDSFQTDIRRCIPHLHSLCKAIDTVSTRQFYHSFINYEDTPAKVSTRQLAVLSVLANNDLTITDVAKHMNISAITAHQHLALARQTLGVATNIAAIKKLVKLGCIHYT